MRFIVPLAVACCASYLVLLTNTDFKSLQCTALSLALKGKVSYPASSTYVASSASYWSVQEESLAPGCIVTPTGTNDVARAVNVLSLFNGKFAIRGGGHTPWAGSANIDSGVTIDMRVINNVVVNNERSVVSVGSGSKWGDVYQIMDSYGLAVIGGRGSTIGVGGLTTGGKLRLSWNSIQQLIIHRWHIISFSSKRICM